MATSSVLGTTGRSPIGCGTRSGQPTGRTLRTPERPLNGPLVLGPGASAHRTLLYASGMDDQRLLERTVESEEIYRGAYLAYRVDTIEDADGHRHTRQVVVHPGAVAMIPIHAGQVLMVRQYRTPAAEVMLELPAGTLDRLDDGTIEFPDVAAPRELGEETGYHAATWRKLGSFYTAPGFATELMHLYLATDLTPIPGYAGPEPDERLELRRIQVAEAVRMAETDEIHDAKSKLGLFWLQRLIDRGEVAV